MRGTELEHGRQICNAGTTVMEIDSAQLRLAESGLRQLSEIIGSLMKQIDTGKLSQEQEDIAAEVAGKYLRIGAAACNLLADTLEMLERG